MNDDVDFVLQYIEGEISRWEISKLECTAIIPYLRMLKRDIIAAIDEKEKEERKLYERLKLKFEGR